MSAASMCDRQAAVDLSHDSEAGRVRLRHVGERFAGSTPATPACGGRSASTRTGAGVPAGGTAHRRLLRRPSARQRICSARASSRWISRPGKRKWHYQLVHHGMWDMDIPCAPILVDITVNGRTVKALAQPTKQSFLYVFDRATGSPIWPIEERPVEQATCRAKRYSPTQPFPPSLPLMTAGRRWTI